jgi:hypothetical protein
MTMRPFVEVEGGVQRLLAEAAENLISITRS